MLPYAPLQRNLQHGPFLELYVDDGFDALDPVLKRKKLREIVITPAFVKGTPMTSPARPNGGRSFHIIRLLHHGKPGWMVELLFCDQNGYLVAFRRKLPNGDWSEWFFFEGEDREMPVFIPKKNCKEMKKVFSCHNAATTIPGCAVTVLSGIFFVLVDPKSGNDLVQRELLCAVIVLCETTRLKIMDETVESRLLAEWWEDPTIEHTLWEHIRSWQKMSNCALDNRNKIKARSNVLVDPQLLGFVSDCGINTIDEVIGPAGQLRLILFNRELFKPHRVVQYPHGYIDRFPELADEPCGCVELREGEGEGERAETRTARAEARLPERLFLF